MSFMMLYLSNTMRVKEFLTILEKDIIYKILKNDQIIMKLVNIFKSNKDGIKNLDNIDNSTKILTVSIKVALKSLENIHTFFYFNRRMQMNI